ncbi:hypothetical protein JXB01_02925, partial [Candidatus Micrarchaeota archaeon]|nr:hypothetical protein [Candidatus Micrarchaeota archaeon]
MPVEIEKSIYDEAKDILKKNNVPISFTASQIKEFKSYLKSMKNVATFEIASKLYATYKISGDSRFKEEAEKRMKTLYDSLKPYGGYRKTGKQLESMMSDFVKGKTVSISSLFKEENKEEKKSLATLVPMPKMDLSEKVAVGKYKVGQLEKEMEKEALASLRKEKEPEKAKEIRKAEEQYAEKGKRGIETKVKFEEMTKAKKAVETALKKEPEKKKPGFTVSEEKKKEMKNVGVLQFLGGGPKSKIKAKWGEQTKKEEPKAKAEEEIKVKANKKPVKFATLDTKSKTKLKTEKIVGSKEEFVPKFEASKSYPNKSEKNWSGRFDVGAFAVFKKPGKEHADIYQLTGEQKGDKITNVKPAKNPLNLNIETQLAKFKAVVSKMYEHLQEFEFKRTLTDKGVEYSVSNFFEGGTVIVTIPADKTYKDAKFD